ncbi:VPLPA-CTERM sorting domain-containing protein [Frigidibacter sp. SD6-1]|uniref:VPLPA-CTERM sorting domain-containing protein n=1 Tax=Frigidibacter sp. SD6-1 TaxID=3032581 RepID=UPI0024DFF44F|nr:VPLPA-CTERM sorting domain-containing protein [Frigidibacter sp. SD6-1]
MHLDTAKSVALGVYFALFAGAAEAATINATFSLSGSAFSNPGLEVETSAGSGSFSVTLAQGQSQTLNLFSLWTEEPTVDPDDLVARQISAAFSLTNYTASGTVNGTTVGTSLFGVLQWGQLNWSAPLTLNYGNGGQLQITLSNGPFNLGFLGLATGALNGLNVTATITNLVEPAPVPLPASGLALLVGLGCVPLVRRRRTIQTALRSGKEKAGR